MKRIILLLLIPILILGQTRINNNAVVISDNNWRDSMVPAFAIGGGTTAPALTPGFAGSAGISTYMFQGGGTTNDFGSFAIQVNHDIDTTSVLSLHIHWANSSSMVSTDTVAWSVEYTVAKIHANFAAPVLDTVYVTAGAQNAWYHHVNEWSPDIAGGSFGISTILVGAIKRLNSLTRDTYAGNCFFLGVDGHYIADGIGSSQEYQK